MGAMTSGATKKDILVAARGLIENKGWTQYAFARNGDVPVPASSKRATCFCALGAIQRARSILSDSDTPAGRFLTSAAGERGYMGIAQFNDDPMTTKADVLSLFDRAIELASQEGA